MNDNQSERIATALERIATALEARQSLLPLSVSTEAAALSSEPVTDAAPKRTRRTKEQIAADNAAAEAARTPETPKVEAPAQPTPPPPAETPKQEAPKAETPAASGDKTLADVRTLAGEVAKKDPTILPRLLASYGPGTKVSTLDAKHYNDCFAKLTEALNGKPTPSEPEVTIDHVKAVAGPLYQSTVTKAEVEAIIRSFGVNKLSELTPAQRAQALVKLQTLAAAAQTALD